MKIKAQFHTLCGCTRTAEIEAQSQDLVAGYVHRAQMCCKLREFVFCWSDRGIAYFTEGRSKV